jgi:Tol biopolymer transport system component
MTLASLAVFVALVAVFALPAVAASSREMNGRIALSAVAANGEIAYSRGKKVGAISPLGGSATTLVAGCAGCYTTGGYAWAPHGRRLAFVGGGSFGGLPKPPPIALYVVYAHGAHLRRLLACGSCGVNYQSAVSWSPDGSRIVMSEGPRMAIVNVKTGAHRLLAPRCNGKRWDVLSPAWSPDGSRIAFVCDASLEVITPGARHAQVVATLPGEDWTVWRPSWSPDGKTLLFDTTDGIYTVRADGSHLTTLLSGFVSGEGGGSYFPSWSPDGTRILYLRASCTDIYCDRPFEVWVMNADGTQNERLYDHSVGSIRFSPPVWSPDGQQIAFSISTSTDSGLMVMNADGTGLHKIAPASFDLAWQPIP